MLPVVLIFISKTDTVINELNVSGADRENQEYQNSLDKEYICDSLCHI